ncbi:hypothetical protein [Desulfomarina sp.]
MRLRYVVIFIFLLVPFVTGGSVLAGDLDDGISKFTDDGMSKYDDLGKADKNIKFIVINAKSKANMMKGKKGKNGKGKKGDANMNSVVLGAGSRVKGDIYIIDQSRGPKTNVAD